MAMKHNWDKIRNQKSSETVKYRDVYEDQQLERGSIADKETMTSRNMINIIISVSVLLLVWLFISLVQMVFSNNGALEQSPNPEYTYMYVNEHYEGVDDSSDKITVDEYNALVETFKKRGKSQMTEPMEPTDSLSDYTFDAGKGGYFIYGDDSSVISSDEYAQKEQEYNDAKAKYEQDMADYKEWLKETTDPSTLYHHVVAHYVNKNKLSDAIYEADYKEKVAQYAEDVKNNKISPDKQDIPDLPYNPKDLYVVDDSESDDSETLNATDASSTQSVQYKNVLDATVISKVEYDELINKYNQDISAYKTAYTTHRQTYHPSDIDGNKKVFKLGPNKWKCIISFSISIFLFLFLYNLFRKNLKAQNLMSDTTDINQYHNDQHIALPEEIQRNYDWFPDVGAHSALQVSSMISHMALQNKGLKQVECAVRADKDILDENGDIKYYKGEILLDDDDNPITKMQPMIDEKFMDALFDASDAPKDKQVRKLYDSTAISYNPDGSNRDKLGKFDKVSDLINADWELPLYEPQRPAGAYIVDTAPVNTMVLAITRAGKGQTVIEPTMDMWSREKRLNNMVANDPKGELIVKNYVRLTVRGMQVVQFNLINAMKTDIYNPLAMAADSAREGDFTKCAMYVENIAEVFFPLDGSDDPVWPNAANNAFKRASYGLIDYYLEEEKAMRRLAERTHIDPKVLEQKIDSMWGKVTLYNCYQLFVQLSSKKMKNPAVAFSAQAKEGKFNDLSDEDYQAELAKVKIKSKLWDDKPEADLLTLYFSATDALPKNSMRTLVSNANNALKSMGSAEKMMASVYGIAITAMSFFTDPTISTLTSGTLSQNVDLGSLSFPRRLGVRFNSDFLQRYHFIGLQCIWNSYEDVDFKKCLGKPFYHEDMVTREGWARYYFDGIYANEVSYIKLEIKNPSSGGLVRTFYFEFKKGYQTSLDGRVYMKDPVLGCRIVKNGTLVELSKFRKKDGTIVYRPSRTTFKQKKILDFKKKGDMTEININAIISTSCRYAEKPKAVFLVTPPHLMKYAKLILILIKQLVDLNFDKSYMTKSNQKPLYKTRFMLDELGNLQSEGHGISGFETMLSIGLGQDQQFTLILQTLQQLREVYGENVDKIVQGNTSNIVYLKSTDDQMIETLAKMSGIRHRTYTDQKTITRDMQAMMKMTQNEGKASYTMTTKEEPVISYNDMAFISERNSIVFRAGDSPIWNRNETILPMSWRLFKNTIIQPGKDYSLQTIPTLSTAMDFDVRKNQPNFSKMLEKRMQQAYISLEAQQSYKDAYGYSDYDIEQLDPDNYSDEIMDIICSTLNPQSIKDEVSKNAGVDQHKRTESDEYEKMFDYMFGNQTNSANDKFNVDQDIYNEFDTITENKEQLDATAKIMHEHKSNTIMRYAGKLLSRESLVSETGVNHSIDSAIITVYKAIHIRMEKDSEFFICNAGNLCGLDGSVYIRNCTQLDNKAEINSDAKDKDKPVFADKDLTQSDMNAIGSYEVTDAFLKFLVQFPGAWPFADGEFERRMKSELSDNQ